jgi:calpain-15
VLAVEAIGNKLIKLRSPLLPINWRGDWAHDSQYWSAKLRQVIGKQHFGPQDNSVLWMSLEEAVCYFISLNVCRVRNWHEIRLKGKFLRLQDQDNPSIENTQSKWFYQFEVTEAQNRLFIGFHQEDERIIGVAETRKNIDLSIAVL